MTHTRVEKGDFLMLVLCKEDQTITQHTSAHERFLVFVFGKIGTLACCMNTRESNERQTYTCTNINKVAYLSTATYLYTHGVPQLSSQILFPSIRTEHP